MIGETISHYKVVEKLGQGGMGVVYKAEDLSLERLVALKFLAPHLASDEDSHKRFIREAKAAATLDHPNICTVYEIAEAQSQTFIAMAYVEGQSLEQLISQGPLDIEEAADLALQVAGALATAHHKGITHRDIKPANILVAERGSGEERQAKLVDFGLAQFAGSSKITRPDSTIGTVAYMSPEQITGKEVDRRTDIWALGVVLYRLVTGQLPFKGHYDAAILYAVVNEEPEPLSAVRAGVPSELERIVNKALAKESEQRYQSMDEMLADLKAERRAWKRPATGGGQVAPAWPQVKTIFLEVCDLEPKIRQRRLEELCGGNRTLRREVEQWLRHDSPDSIFEDVEEEEAAGWSATGEMDDPYVGRTIQSYKLLAVLGRGGMGKVYRAEDIRLKRAVAVKFLSPRLVRDERQKKRFLREAQAMAALDHPSICPVYDVGEVDGRPYTVTAYIAGDNLADALRAGGLSVDTALGYAIQIGEGLEAAHELGILHRDMKPGNVILASRGEGKRRAKIIDFGLSHISGVSDLSEPGQLIGTAGYIAPELLQGKRVDARGDIWSLGVMLYEMLSGRQPFDAESRERLFYAICHDEPEPLRAASGELPAEAGRVVAKALAKDPERRYGNVRDLVDDLRDLKRRVSVNGIAAAGAERARANGTSPLSGSEIPTSAASPSEAVGSRRRERWSVLDAAGAVIVLAAIASVAWLLGRSHPVPPPPEIQRLTFESGLALHPALSPDGKYVAFASDRAGEGNLDIWVQALPGDEPVRLTKDAADEDFPSFSPDGARIAFQSERDGRGIYSIPILGGEPRLLAREGSQPRYSPDGRWLSFTLLDVGHGQQGLTTSVFLAPAAGGELTEFRTGFLSSSNPVWAPDSSRLLYAGSDLHTASEMVRFQISAASPDHVSWYITPVSGGRPARIEPSRQFGRFLAGFPIPLAWLPNNQILFSYASRDTANLWVATLSSDNRRIIGSPEQLTFGTGRITDASVAGGLVAFTIASPRPRLWDIPLETREAGEGNEPIDVVTSHDFTYWPSLSDTGKLAYLAQRFDRFNLWLNDLASGKETMLASIEGGGNINLVSAYINRTGTRLAYTASHESNQAIYAIGTEDGTPERVCVDCGLVRSWSPDGGVMLSQERVLKGSDWVSTRINRIDVASGRSSVLFEKASHLFSPDFSPDGRWVAFQARDAIADRMEQLFLAPMSDDAPVEPERWIPLTDLKHFDANPKFSQDGEVIYFNSDRDGFTCLWAVRLNPATMKPIAKPFPVKHFHGNPRHYSWYPVFGIGPDRIVISLEEVQSDLWMTQLPK